jgi:predicted RNase H-like HicB family nuclease
MPAPLPAEYQTYIEKGWGRRSGRVTMAHAHPAMRVRFTAAVTQEDDWYVARCLEVEVTSQGATVESAVAHLREALELHFEDTALADVPPSPILAPVEVEVPGRGHTTGG